MVRKLSPAASSKASSATTYFGNDIPPKPTVSPYEVALYNQTRRMWEVRPKSITALRHAGLAPPLTKPAAATTTTTTTTTIADAPTNTIPVFRPGSISSVSSSSNNNNKEPRHRSHPPPLPPPATKLFHDPCRPRAPLTAEQQERLAPTRAHTGAAPGRRGTEEPRPVAGGGQPSAGEAGDSRGGGSAAGA